MMDSLQGLQSIASNDAEERMKVDQIREGGVNICIFRYQAAALVQSCVPHKLMRGSLYTR
jgi:hypothetical protein